MKVVLTCKNSIAKLYKVVDCAQIYNFIPNSDCFIFFIFYFLGFFLFCFNLFIFYFWLCWVFVSVRGLSPVAASRGHSSSRCAGPSPSRPLSLRGTGSRHAGSAVVAHGPSCSAACGIFPDQGSNPCPLHWQADSQPLRHQRSPDCFIFKNTTIPLKPTIDWRKRVT